LEPTEKTRLCLEGLGHNNKPNKVKMPVKEMKYPHHQLQDCI